MEKNAALIQFFFPYEFALPHPILLAARDPSIFTVSKLALSSDGDCLAFFFCLVCQVKQY